eukprot:11138081-Karenia_brevis.AAC.1
MAPRWQFSWPPWFQVEGPELMAPCWRQACPNRAGYNYVRSCSLFRVCILGPSWLPVGGSWGSRAILAPSW